mgnify:CR=1 FL=1
MFNYTASNSDVLSGVATNQAVASSAAYSAYGRSAPTTVSSTSTLLAANNIVVATASGITLTLPLTSTYAVAQLNTTQLVVYNSSSGSITVQGQSQFPSTSFSITGSTTSGSTYSLDATHLPTVVGGSIATNLFTATADNASAQSFDNVVGSGITALTPQMVLTPGSIFTVDGTSTNTSLVLLNSTSGLLSNGSKIWCDDGGTIKNITAGNVVATTQDNSGAPWVQQTLPSNANWNSITYGNGAFVAISNGTNGAKSTDGVNWISVTLPSGSNTNWQSVTYGNGTFVAVAPGGNSATTSLDGITWTPRTLPVASFWYAVTYGNGLFVAVTSGSNDDAATSSDGITWTPRILPFSAQWECITYGAGLFVALTNGSSGYATSPNGVVWTSRNLPLSGNWTSITYGGGLFVAIAFNNNVALVSIDGINWTQRTLPTVAVWRGVTYGDGVFAVVAQNSSIAATSTDGITWTQRLLPATAGWFGIAYGNGLFATVAFASTIAATSNAGYFRKYTCTAISPSLSNVPTWVAKGGQTLAGSISTTSTPNFSAVVPTTYTTTRVNNTLTITANQLSGFTSGTHVQLKAQTLSNGDVMSALNAVSNSQGINGTTALTIAANASVSMIPTTNSGWIAI